MTVALGTSIPTSITVVATSTSAPPAANAAIDSCLSRGRIWPCRSTTSKSRSSPARSRSYSAVAARAWSASDSSAGRQLAQHGHVEIAVGGQRERAWDRRGGHVQHVRGEAVRRLAVERAALVYAE